jgi:hypothetical protein
MNWTLQPGSEVESYLLRNADRSRAAKRRGNMMNTKTIVAAVAGLILAAAGAQAAAAQDFAQTHPRRAEVNQRLDRQDARIAAERADGAIGPAKAHRLHRADHRIRMAERRFARRHGGHISKMEQARLNHRENAVSRRIG